MQSSEQISRSFCSISFRCGPCKGKSLQMRFAILVRCGPIAITCVWVFGGGWIRQGVWLQYLWPLETCLKRPVHTNDYKSTLHSKQQKDCKLSSIIVGYYILWTIARSLATANIHSGDHRVLRGGSPEGAQFSFKFAVLQTLFSCSKMSLSYLKTLRGPKAH